MKEWIQNPHGLSSRVRLPDPLRSQRLAFFALLIWITTSLSAVEAPAGRPNVLFIAVDDLRPELGCYDVDRVKTPAIDRLALSGVLFNQAYCQQAICAPSRISLLSGLRPDTTGIYGLNTRLSDKMPDWKTLPRAFKDAGYETISIGKIYHHYHGQSADDPQGWSRPPMKASGSWQGRGYLEAESFEAAVKAFLPSLPENAEFLELPEFWKLQMADDAESQTVELKKGRIDFHSHFPNLKLKDHPVATLTTDIHSPTDRTAWIGAGADWWMNVDVNGENAFSTMKDGNQTSPFGVYNHVFPIHLRKGTNTLNVQVRSGTRGWELVMGSGERLKEALNDPRNAFESAGGRGPAWEAADVPDNAYPDGANTDLAIELMQEIKDGPFFLAVGMMKPHLPFNAPKKYWDLYDRDSFEVPPRSYPQGVNEYSLIHSGELRNYVGMPKRRAPWTDEESRTLIHGYLASVSYIDAQIDRLLVALEENGLADNTIVVLWGDHGWKLGEYGEWCKHSNFEVDTRVPLLIRAPGVSEPNTRVDALTELIDLYPTLCDLAGIQGPEGLEGTSLVPWLRDPDHPGREAAFMQYPRENAKVMGYSVKTADARYVRWIRMESGDVLEEEFYDHTTDPGETVNLVNDPAVQDQVERHRHLHP